jgi:hypothetical protein
MKPSHLLVPAALLLAIGSVWLISLRVERRTLSREVEKQRSTLRQATREQAQKKEAEAAEYAAHSKRLAEVREQLAIEQKTAADMAAQKSELQSMIPKVDDDEMVVSFGRIHDMAAEIGEALLLFLQMASRKDKDFAPEDSQVAAALKMMSWLPEITGFEDTPAEISCLQAGMIAKTFDLDPAAAARAEQIISDHFAQMKALRVTAASKDRPGWRDQRSASLTQLMWKLRPILPANSDATPCLPLILNMGAGMEKQVDVKVDQNGETQGAVSMSIATWPRVPWLPEEPTKAGTP